MPHNQQTVEIKERNNAIELRLQYCIERAWLTHTAVIKIFLFAGNNKANEANIHFCGHLPALTDHNTIILAMHLKVLSQLCSLINSEVKQKNLANIILFFKTSPSLTRH